MKKTALVEATCVLSRTSKVPSIAAHIPVVLGLSVFGGFRDPDVWLVRIVMFL